jgi:serine/threonine-protein kinase
MSPEQILSAEAVDLRSDLWSLGVVAYHALTGTLPFVAETLGALCVAIDHGVFPSPSSRRPGLGPGLDAWFGRALARDPAARFGSAKEMAEALQQASQNIGAFSMAPHLVSAPALSVQRAGAPAQTLMDASVTAVEGKKSALPLIALVGGLSVAALVGLVLVLLGIRSSASPDPATAAEPIASLATPPLAPPEPRRAAALASAEPRAAPTLESAEPAPEKPAATAAPAATRKANNLSATKTTTVKPSPPPAPTPTKRDYGF